LITGVNAGHSTCRTAPAAVLSVLEEAGMKEPTKGIFGAQLPGALEQDILRLNPWWKGNPLPPLPRIRRVDSMRNRT